MKKPLVLDVETTIKNKGNPFTNGNKLCYTGLKYVNERAVIFNHLKQGLCTREIQNYVSNASYLIVFNGKFDCHWLESIGVILDGVRIWDAQYAEFIFNNQLTKYPSLEEAATKYGLGHKLDIIKTEYWEKGIDTPDIPEQLLCEYLEQDLNLTEQLFLKQYNLFQELEKSKWRLFQLHMEDQHVLREMERNGILYDTETSLKKAEDASIQIKDIEANLRKGYENVPINWDSGDHLSAFLYGGVITEDVRIPIGVYKTGQKTGQVRNKVVQYKYELKKQFDPLPKSELKKEGFYATDEKTLKQLRGSKEAKRVLCLLDERSKLEKLRGTYYAGFPKKITEMAWRNNYLHPNFNQCVAVTGRLSSTNPNGQNQPPESKQLCISRYS